MLVFLRDKTIEMSCIYYFNKENLTYNKKEHIFPATIGGIETLPVGYVSDQANEYFSKFESNLVTSSFIGLEKSFWGPGERGKKVPGRLPITIFADGEKEELGFTFMGKPHAIPQIIISEDIGQVRITRDDFFQTNKDLDKLIENIGNFNNKYTILSSKPNKANFIIGFYKNRTYISTRFEDKIKEYVEYIKSKVLDNIDYNKAKIGLIDKPCTVINMAVSADNDARIFAKTALNLIAKIKGCEYANKSDFDGFKKWIMGEENDIFNQLPKDLKLFQFLDINDKIHYCALMNIDGFFVASVIFYNHWTMRFDICPAFDTFFNTPYIYFCDWQNNSEYSLLDLLKTI